MTIVKLLDSVQNVNSFVPASSVEIVRGNPGKLYLRLWNKHLNDRYVPASGATMWVTFDNLDLSAAVQRAAVAEFAGDSSIWYVPLLATDQLQYNSIRVTLSEGGVAKKLLVDGTVSTFDSDSRRNFI